MPRKHFLHFLDIYALSNPSTPSTIAASDQGTVPPRREPSKSLWGSCYSRVESC